MSFGTSPSNPRRWVGLGAVIALHLVIFYALLLGLRRHPVDIAPHSVNVRLIEDAVRTTPTAPPQREPAPPKPQIQSQPAQPVMPREPAPIAPTVPETLAAPPTPSTPPATEATPAAAAPSAPVSAPAASVVCPGYQDAIRMSPPPREVMQEGIGGEVLVEFTVTPNGTVRNPIPISSTNPKLNRWALATVLTKIRCQGQAQAVQLRVPISVRFE